MSDQWTQKCPGCYRTWRSRYWRHRALATKSEDNRCPECTPFEVVLWQAEVHGKEWAIILHKEPNDSSRTRMHNRVSIEGDDWVDWPIVYGSWSLAYDSPQRIPALVKQAYRGIVIRNMAREAQT